MTTALFHGYSVPPSSIAVTKRIDAARSKKNPIRSNLLALCLLVRASSSTKPGGCGKFDGRNIRMGINETTPAGPLLTSIV